MSRVNCLELCFIVWGCFWLFWGLNNSCQWWKPGFNAKKKPPCLDDNGACSKGFPKPFSKQTIIKKDGYPTYRRLRPLEGGFTYEKNGFVYNDSHVVPYNPYALMKYTCHLNCENTSSMKQYKYINKYLNKGPDMICAEISDEKEPNNNENEQNKQNQDNSNEEKQDNDNRNKHRNEIDEYVSGRFVTPDFGFWRLNGWPLHEATPPVRRLSVHLPDENVIYWQENEDEDYDERQDRLLQKIEKFGKSTLTEYFSQVRKEQDHPLSDLELAALSSEKIPAKRATELLYTEFPTYFKWNKRNRSWERYKKPTNYIARMYEVHPTQREKHWLSRLLKVVKGATSFDDLKVIEGTQYYSFESAADALGLIPDDKEYFECVKEAARSQSPYMLRKLFVDILLKCTISSKSAQNIWNEFKDDFSDDILYQRRKELKNRSLQFDDTIWRHALFLINSQIQLEKADVSVTHWGLPEPQKLQTLKYNIDVINEENYDMEELARIVPERVASLNVDQKKVFDKSMELLQKGDGGGIVLLADGGTGKTFLSNTILAAARLKKKICCPVASTGLAAMLLEGGARTAHARFGIPFRCNSESELHWKSKGLKELVRKCEMSVWDEFTQQNRDDFETVDRGLRGLTGHMDKPWGKKFFLVTGTYLNYNQTKIYIAFFTFETYYSIIISSGNLYKLLLFFTFKTYYTIIICSGNLYKLLLFTFKIYYTIIIFSSNL